MNQQAALTGAVPKTVNTIQLEDISVCMKKSKWLVCLAKTQIGLGIDTSTLHLLGG